MSQSMSNVIKKYCVAVATCLAVTAAGTSPALSDALAGEPPHDASASMKNIDFPASGPASSDATPRQHVKHLRAHKKNLANTTTDPAQTPSKSDTPQLYGVNSKHDDATAKVAVKTATPSATVKTVARKQNKIARPRAETARKATNAARAAFRPAPQRDFFSDIFGGDE